MSSFYPMSPRDRAFILAVLVFAIIAFYPDFQEIQVAGMSLFGWLMAALMVFSPLFALLHFWLDRKPGQRKGGSE